MKAYATPTQCFGFCKIAGLGLLFAFWVKSGETAGFFLLLFLAVMSLLRWRIPKWGITVLVDFAVCAILSVTGNLSGIILALPLFEAMYLGFYWSAISTAYAVYALSPPYTAIMLLVALCGYFLSAWTQERKHKQQLRDTTAGRYYELESLQSDLLAALAQIEQMTAVAERTRIARDIHDNAGHEIVAAYMSFQTIRQLYISDDTDMMALYDAALARLAAGTDKIREAVHNLSAVAHLGVDRIREKCLHFSVCNVNLSVYGDTARIPIYIWSMLESCLNEVLTNIARHASATWVTVELDATPHIVRLRVANDGVRQNGNVPGYGLRNLRHRAAAIGGSLSVDSGEVFSVICVIPMRRVHTEGTV